MVMVTVVDFHHLPPSPKSALRVGQSYALVVRVAMGLDCGNENGDDHEASPSSVAMGISGNDHVDLVNLDGGCDDGVKTVE